MNQTDTLPLNKTTVPRILVVDDEPIFLKFIVKALKAEKYDITTAESGSEALDLIQTQSFDLVLSDINLPGTSGVQLLRECRDNNTSTRIILMTGNPDLDDAVSTVKDGAFDYLAKPIRLQKLKSKVKAALEYLPCHKPSFDKTQVVHELPGDDCKPIKELGSGGIGTVYLVEKNGMRFAMKVLQGKVNKSLKAKTLQRFMREGELISRLNHPGIVKVVEYGLSPKDATPYLLMEYIPGRSLEDIIEKEPLEISLKRNIILQIAEALQAVHEQGILHRDIKPGNIIITRDNQVKITDFGTARLSTSELTRAQEVLGSPAYMAPENFSQTEIDNRADIFSLGVLSYQFITGKKPFEGNSLVEVFRSISEHLPPAPSKYDTTVTPALEKVLAGMLEKDPAKRYQTMSDIVRDLKNIHPTGKLGLLTKRLQGIFSEENKWS